MEPITIGLAAAGLGQGLLSAGQSRWNVKKTIKAQQEAAELKHTKDLEQWQRANEYNSPAAQMARLQAAGLNPNLVYGSGGVTGNTSGGSVQYQDLKPEHNVEPILQNIPGMLSQYQDFRMRNVQIDNAKKQGDILESEQKIKHAEAIMRHGMLLSKRSQLDAAGSRTQAEAELKSLQYDYWTDYGRHGAGIDRAPKYGQLMDYQLASKGLEVQGKRRGLDLMAQRIGNLEADTAMKKKLFEWYEFNTFSKLGAGMLGQIGKLVPAGRAAKAIGGIKGINKKFDRWPGTFPKQSTKF